MKSSLIERYQQILNQDPASTVFVELAKALILKEEYAQAIEICQKGLEHHPESVIGRVLWGKALIYLRRPAEAMEQFDRATSIERENPYAYNLIAEVLLQKGLYRSALPLLRKAVALQPNDARVKDWLEKAQAALSGGPAPTAEEVTNPGSPLLALADPAEGAPSVMGDSGPHPQLPPEKVDGGAGAEPSLFESQRETKPEGAPQAPGEPSIIVSEEAGRPGDAPRASGEKPAIQGDGAEQPPAAGEGSGEAPRRASGEKAGIGAEGAEPPAGEAMAGGDAPRRASGEKTPPGGGTRASGEKARASGEKTPPGDGTRASGEKARPSGEKKGLRTREPFTPPGGPPRLEAAPEAPPPDAPSGSGLLPDLPPPPDDFTSSGGVLPDLPAPPGEEKPAAEAKPPPAKQPPPGAPPPLRRSGEKRAILTDIPELVESATSLEAPKVEVSSSTASEIAKEYERELREKLAENATKKTFLVRHGGKLAVLTVVIAAAAVGLGAFLWTRSRNRGRDLQDTLAEARKAIALDTTAGYRDALTSLGTAIEMDEGSAEAWALTGYAQSVLFAEHGAEAERRAKALDALAKGGVAERYSGLAMAARYYAADGKERDAARRAVLSATVDSPEVQELAGRLLLGQKDTRAAVERFRRALELSSSNVRALVALGNYYRDAKDFSTALRFYDTAALVSPLQPERAVGSAESRLELHQDLDKALAELDALPAGEELPPDLMIRRELAHARVLAANGRAQDAVQRLTERAGGLKGRAYDYNMALGEVSVAAGDYAQAERAYDAALKARAGSEEAKEGLGRVLIGRGHAKEVLSRIRPDADERKAWLVRGMAYAALEDWKHARAELARTQVSGKYPSEAVIYLALADAAEGDSKPPREALENALGTTKKAKADVRVALGTIYLREGQRAKAREQFEKAAEEAGEYEAPCALGRLYAEDGDADKAAEALQLAVSRNGSHGEARHALGRLLLAQGKPDGALAQAEAWAQDDPGAAAAQKDLALALHVSGKWKEADGASARAVKLDASDPEAHRIRALVLFGIGDARGAFGELERANKLDPKDPETFCEIGWAFMRQGNKANAGAAFGAAMRERPGIDCGAIGQLAAELPSGARGAVKVLSDRAAKAKTAWDRAQAAAALARAQLVVGNAKQARKAADEAVAGAPWLANAHWANALVLEKEKEQEKARGELRQAVDLEPAHGPLRLALADELARSGELEAAIKEYETFLKLGGDSADLKRVQKALPELKKRLESR